MNPAENRSRLQAEAYQSGLEALVVFKGRLVLENCESVRNRLHTLITPKTDKIYIYMGALDYVDSAGWGTMVGLKMAANRNRSKLLFLAPSERILDIVRISKLDSIFEIKTGAEAELIRSHLEKPEHLVWRDGGDESRERRPDTHYTPGFGAVGLSPRATPEHDPRKKNIENLSRDAVEHLRQGDYQKVIDCYRRILELDPEDLSALNNLGVVYGKRSEWHDLAIQTWNRVLELSQRSKDEKHASRARRHLDLLTKMGGG